MAPKFGTSGLRGLVTELTPELVADYIRAFIAACPMGSGLYIGRDLRASSPDLAGAVAEAARGEGLAVTDCGAVPTPALALVAMQAGAAAVMVTGSHIPADRNGLKFYGPDGEITKNDEAAILAHLGRTGAGHTGSLQEGPDAGAAWLARAIQGWGKDALSGMKIGVWSHSAVSRDLLLQGLAGLGAEAVELGRSEEFVPVDTEAVPEDVRADFRAWAAEHGLDAIVSTDGDGDRPLLADGLGRVVPGDVLGQITARALGAEAVVTTVSANSGVAVPGRFATVTRTKIGSPYVIAAMAEAGAAKVAGYEPNGGFLLGFTAEAPSGQIAPLATRDSLLPLIAALAEAKRAGSLAARVAEEPACFTATDRLEEIPAERSRAFLETLSASPREFLGSLGEELQATDQTDGLRLSLVSGRVVHLRPSGNAPEFRIYSEAESPAMAEDLLRRARSRVASRLR